MPLVGGSRAACPGESVTGARPAVSIDSIQEVSEGRRSEIFQRYPDGSFDPNCCFSIYHGSHRQSLDLVSPSGDEARTWVTGLRYLMAGISDEDSLARRQRTRDQYPWTHRQDPRGPPVCPEWGSPGPGWVAHLGSGSRKGVGLGAGGGRAGPARPVLAPNSAPKWLKQTFDEADKNGDGSLSVGEVLQLLRRLNANLPRQEVKRMFKVRRQRRRPSEVSGSSQPARAAEGPAVAI